MQIKCKAEGCMQIWANLSKQANLEKFNRIKYQQEAVTQERPTEEQEEEGARTP